MLRRPSANQDETIDLSPIRCPIQKEFAGNSAENRFDARFSQYEYDKVLAVQLMESVKEKDLPNNRVAFANLQNITYQHFLKSEIDLKRLQLTDTGFKKI